MSVYNPNIPQPGDFLSDSQQDMLNNFSQLDTSFGVNHYQFSDNTASNGKHSFIEMVNEGALPVGLVTGEGTIYTKAVNNGSDDISQIYYSTDDSGNEYQLSRADDIQFARFGSVAEYQVGPPSLKGGWSFLPGGLLIQYGSITNLNVKSNNPTTVVFPRDFTNPPLTITITAEKSGNSPTTDNAFVKNGTITKSQFQIVTTDTSQQIGYWMAIGI